MRTAEEIIQVLVGDPELTPVAVTNSEHARLFSRYTVTLPLPAFRGLPPEWHFAVLDPKEEVTDQAARGAVIHEARQLVNEVPAQEPLVLVSEHANVHLVDEFTTMDRNVFPLDATDYPKGRPQKRPPRLAYFLTACQRKLGTRAASVALQLFPYSRNRPVSGWRFFGRKKELQSLVHDDENFMVVGARRVGKSSLLQEAARLKQLNGEEVYYADVQHCKTAGDVVGAIIRAISAREAAQVIRHHGALDESVLSMLLRRLAARRGRVTLFLDELGNVISRESGYGWEFLGLLRGQAQRGNLRIVFSCFQEVFLRQAADFEGPAVNFGTVLRLGLFSPAEADEFVCGPLEFWSPLKGNEKKALLKVVHEHVGYHPYLLQHFCHALYRSLVEGEADVLQTAKNLVRRRIEDVFAGPVEETFYRLGSPLLMYLFLRACHDADIAGKEIRSAEFTTKWITDVLRELGLASTSQRARNLMEGLEVHALCAAEGQLRSRQKVASPIVYECVRASEGGIEDLLKMLEEDARSAPLRV